MSFPTGLSNHLDFVAYDCEYEIFNVIGYQHFYFLLTSQHSVQRRGSIDQQLVLQRSRKFLRALQEWLLETANLLFIEIELCKIKSPAQLSIIIICIIPGFDSFPPTILFCCNRCRFVRILPHSKFVHTNSATFDESLQFT